MSNALKVTTVGTDPLASDVAQLANLFNAALEAGLMQLSGPQSTPAAPTVTDAAVAGNLNGAYLWKMVLVTGWKQSDRSYYVSGFAPSAESASLSLTNSQASLSNIGTGTIVVIGRAIYRTAAGGAAGTEKFAGIIWDNGTTTWTDNVADANLGTGMPSSSSSPAAYGTAIPASVPATNTTGTSLSGTIDATSLDGILAANFIRGDSGAPNPQTVANPVELATFTTIGDSTNGYIQVRTDSTAVYLEAINGAQTASKTLKLVGLNANDTPVETGANTLDDGSGNMAIAGSITSPNPTFVGSQIFTSSGTFTVPTGVKRLFVQVWGAGGGGAQGAYNQQYATCYGGGGGGGGGYAEGWIEVSAGQQIAVTVGAGGAPGTGANGTQLNLGGTGGTSSFGSYVQATGGTGGYQSEAGTGQPQNATGGSGGLGNLGTYGATGNNGGGAGSNTTNGQNGGGGATSMAGPGGAGSTSTSAAGGNGYAPGGGGGGGYANPYTSVTAGGSGARGEVRVHY